MLTPAGDATVVIPLGAQVKYGDEVVLDWDGDGKGGKTQISYMALSDQTAPIRMLVPAKFVVANVDHDLRVSYTVCRFAGNEQSSGTVKLRVQKVPLPLPVFVEATAGQQLNPDDVVRGATVLIDAVAHFKRGDKVTVSVESPVSSGNFSQVITIAAGDEEKALRVTVPYNAINASNRQSITLKFAVERVSGVPVENSPVNTYLVNRVIGSGLITVCGARYGASTYRCSSTSRIISAFNRQTLQPMLVEWRYKGDVAWTAGTTWFDRQPWRALRVRSQSDEVELNPANIIGNGVDAWSMAARHSWPCATNVVPGCATWSAGAVPLTARVFHRPSSPLTTSSRSAVPAVPMRRCVPTGSSCAGAMPVRVAPCGRMKPAILRRCAPTPRHSWGSSEMDA
ncbi:hypothetical protein [Pseudomonas brassicae]|uniref:hypothetical protein n=1 Tax=Pseudomonas brassicae TaxID=2708063 RepID=UPI0013D75F7E|nr:hypothetical protein [Pseudomonas brassicae]